MRFRSSPFRSTLIVGCLMAAAGTFALAQGRGGGGPGGGPPGGGGMRGGGGPQPGMPGGFPGNAPGAPPPGAPGGSPTSSMRGGLQLGPPGRWWDDKHFAKDLKLRPEQQRRMDSIFEDNRGALVDRLQALQGEESRMEALSRSKTPDEAALFGQIDRVAQARAELEKASTHYLLAIRREMDPEQIGRLDEHR